ncbi:MAG: AAA family ATPase [Candidatus Binataceae bacterium]
MAGFSSRPSAAGIALRIQIVGESEAARRAVKEALAAATEVPPLEVMEVTPADAMEQTAAAPDLAMVVFEANEAPSLGYLQAQAERVPRPLLCGLLPEPVTPLMRRALRAGADELMFMPLAEADVVRTLLKVTETRHRSERREGGAGVVFSVTSLAGGAGVTTVSGNLALALRGQLDQRVGLIDLALQSGGLGMFLRLDPQQSITSLDDARRLDSIRLEAALTKHGSGVYLLAAPRQIEDSERLNGEMVATVLALMRQLFDFVVVDCGRHVDDKVLAAWEHSDEVLYVLDQALTAARAAARFVEMFRRLKLRESNPRLVLNRYDSHSSISLDHLNAALPARIFARIPRDRRALERAQMRGQELKQGNSVMMRATEELARRLALSHKPPPRRGAGLKARLLGVVGARA